MLFNSVILRKLTISRAVGAALAIMLSLPIMGVHVARAEQSDATIEALRKKKFKKAGGIGAPPSNKVTQGYHPVAQGKATTETEVLTSVVAAPMLSASSVNAMQAAEAKYQQIVSNGGWPTVPKGTYKKGGTNKNIAALNMRLYIEGYVRREATEGEFAAIYTSATQDAVMRFQRNNGLGVSGAIDGPTLAALNVPAAKRLSTIRANIARVAEYSKGLGDRYIIVNVPAQQIETVSGGRVYSRHNAIVGRPERPTPVVMTAISDINFNPYWNAPPSIIERDIIPKISNGNVDALRKMNIRVFQGFGGPEIDPSRVNWASAVADDYHFRQEPGGENAMATAKINFSSPFGIYLHDTPEKQLFQSGGRFFSSGCVRVQKVEIFINWILNGQDGFDANRIEGLAQSLDRLDVKIINPPQLRVAYLTAWPTNNGTVAFRNDIYNLDGSGFVLGQPLPVGEVGADGQRYVLKPIARQPSAIDAAEADGFTWFGKRASNKVSTSVEKTVKSASRAVTNIKQAAVSKLGAAAKAKPKGLFDWANYKRETAKPKIVKKKTVTTTKLAKAKTTTKVVAVEDKKAAAKTLVKPAAAKKPVDKCKPDKDGKLPKDCKVEAVAKPKVKPDKQAIATN
jgi:L,D-transpeptidase YcbB